MQPRKRGNVARWETDRQTHTHNQIFTSSSLRLNSLVSCVKRHILHGWFLDTYERVELCAQNECGSMSSLSRWQQVVWQLERNLKLNRDFAFITANHLWRRCRTIIEDRTYCGVMTESSWTFASDLLFFLSFNQYCLNNDVGRCNKTTINESIWRKSG